jgi:tubulin polyglutamylase TTLL6/13
MIDGNGKAYLLEINHTPSFTTDTPLDDLVKSNLVRDTLILMNINSKSRDKILSEVKS